MTLARDKYETGQFDDSNELNKAPVICRRNYSECEKDNKTRGKMSMDVITVLVFFGHENQCAWIYVFNHTYMYKTHVHVLLPFYRSGQY